MSGQISYTKNKKTMKKRFQKLENENVMIDTPLYKHMVSQGIIKPKGEKKDD
jgi:hypothetical protein